MILALDFDGVICDSADECLSTSYRVYREMYAEALPLDPSEAHRHAFAARRGVVRPSGHYYLLWKWLTQFPGRSLTPLEFEAMAETHRDDVEKFAAAFHASRDAAREHDSAAWISLNPLYPDVRETWPRLKIWHRYIVTTKDRASTIAILEANGLEVTGVYARGGPSKPDALREISRRHGLAPNRVVFVDDNGLHLREAVEAGVTAVFAGWGYGPSAGFSGPVLTGFSQLADFMERREQSE